MTEQEFEGLDEAGRRAAITHHDEHVRLWAVTFPCCGFRFHGTLGEIRGKRCPVCTRFPEDVKRLQWLRPSRVFLPLYRFLRAHLRTRSQ